MTGPKTPAKMKSHPYAGRWLARIGSQVLAQGGSPVAVHVIAQQNRPKEKHLITYIPLTNIMSYPDFFYRIQSALSEREDIFLVGGAVRDALLQKTIHDFDFVCLFDPQSAARKIANMIDGNIFCMDKEHQVYRVIPSNTDYSNQVIDFMLARSKEIEHDLQMRDFTINAMAVNLQDPQKIIDPLHGAHDLITRKLIGCSPEAFIDDPIRILRGIRIAAEGDYQIEKSTRDWMKISVPLLGNVSVERRRDELIKIFVSPKPEAAFRALIWLKALEYLIPDFDEINKTSGNDWMENYLRGVSCFNLLCNILTNNQKSDSPLDLISGIAINELRKFREYFSRLLKPSNLLANPPKAIWLLGWLGFEISREINNGMYPEIYARWFHLSNQEIKTIINISRGIKQLANLSLNTKLPDNLATYHFFRDTKEDGLAASCIWLSQRMAVQKAEGNPDQWAFEVSIVSSLWENFWFHPEIIHPPQIIDGHDIVTALGIDPSKKIGLYLQAICEAQVVGTVQSKNEAIEYIKRLTK